MICNISENIFDAFIRKHAFRAAHQLVKPRRRPNKSAAGPREQTGILASDTAMTLGNQGDTALFATNADVFKQQGKIRLGEWAAAGNISVSFFAQPQFP
ncbi:hypothetical protein [Rhodoblastus sp.]|uniref:hypothetical protein n=1 Tax=Rhodoblastus sp. TaxID=1962975 RepID=UPI00261FDF58|nr:hypothetical protein [Rhodoblastus sp.]